MPPGISRIGASCWPCSAAGFVAAAILLALPTARIVESRWREAFFIGWSFLVIALIVGVIAADGGTESPFRILLVLPLVFASLTYPLRPFLAVVAMTLGGYAIVAIAQGGGRNDEQVFFAFGLAALAFLCIWHVREQDARKAEMERVETALADTERAGVEILETAYEAYISIDDEGTITGWNRSAESMFGWSRTEVLGRPLDETIIPEHYREAHQRGIERFGKTGEGPILGKRIAMTALRREGTEFPVELSIAPVRAGGTVGFHAFVDDITKRQAAELSLRESEERFRSLVEGVTDYAVYPLDPDGLIEGWNEGAERMYGYSREEMHGEPVTKLLRPGDTTDNAEVLRRAENEGRAELEAWRVRADGTAFLANVIITPLRARSGRLRGFATITRDVTERTRAQEALREAEERFRGAFEAAPTGIALIDLSPETVGHFLQVNAALCDIAGRSSEDLLSTSLQSISHPEDVKQETELLRDLLGGTVHRQSIEGRFMRPEGEVVWASVSASIVRDANGSPLYAIVQLQDVSERKRFEGQLQYLADHDALTGLLNRRRFEQELRQQVALADRHEAPGAVLVIDLDNFKYVNDTLGHAIGDELIGRVATLVASCLRRTDTVARLGGDEFAVLLPETPVDEAVKLAGELRDEISSESVVGGGRGIRLTVSVGVSRFGGR